MNTIHIQKYNSPFGELILGSFEDKLCMCDWVNGKRHNKTSSKLQKALNANYSEDVSNTLKEAIIQLDEYFSCKRTYFTIPLLFIGTPFQKQVWSSLLTIPYGQTISYASQASSICHPKSFRAVANANGANPISIFAPCHRVVGSDQSLTGYGGSLSVKKALLNLEKAQKSTGISGFNLREKLSEKRIWASDIL